MSDSKVIPRLWLGILLVVLIAAGLYLRIVLPYDQVLVGDSIRFTARDAYYYMRQVDNLVHNFPHFSTFDPYLNYPHGASLGVPNLFVYLLSGLIWLIGLGSPTQHTVDVVGVYFPAVLGALTIIPVYFIGKNLFNRWAGIVAAALLAILPGEFLGRSILGATDRDALEVLLTALTMLFLILGIKTARERQLIFPRLNLRHLSVLTRPILYSLLSGISLGLYLLTWRGAFLFVLIILVYFVIQSTLDHLKQKSFDYLSFVGVVTLLIALSIFAPVSQSRLYSAALAIPLLVLLALQGLAWLLARLKIRPLYYPLSVLGVGLLSLGIFFVVSPSLFKSMLEQFSVFVPTQAELTIIEMQPILFPAGTFSLAAVWGNYTTGFFLSLISLGALIYLAIKRGESDKVLLVVWSLIMLAATLALRRMALLFAINVALLTGYLAIVVYFVVQLIIVYMAGRSTDYASSQVLEFAGFKGSPGKPLEKFPKSDYYEVLGVPRNATNKQVKKAYQKLVSKYRTGDDLTNKDEVRFRQITKAYAVLSDHHTRASYDRSQYGRAKKEGKKTKPRKEGNFGIAGRQINMAVASFVIFFLVLFPNIKPATSTVNEGLSFAPSDAWYQALCWLRDNSPEPFGENSSYYDFYQLPFHYPETAYGVAAWWDYGYWITRIGHRLPNCHPGGGARELVARLFTAQDQALAKEIANDLNCKYIAIDDATVTGKFWAVATYAGSSQSQFLDLYYQVLEGSLQPVVYYHEEYYRSLAVRLYYFDGHEVTSDNCTVISYVEKVSPEGIHYRQITEAKSFTSYEEAIAYMSKQESGNYRIASDDPYMSPVPLARLEYYRPVNAVLGLEGWVKIFEYTE